MTDYELLGILGGGFTITLVVLVFIVIVYIFQDK